MVNDTTTLNGALAELGETLADNLVSMGVTNASASDGLTTLAGKILNIAPSVGGITPTVSIDISKTPSTVYVGANVLISAKVNADYDDTSSVDIDLKGVLQGATVTFKNNGTTLGTGITGSDGIATYTISNIQSEDYSITAHFDGTGTDYESATSTALTFTVQSYIFYDDCSSASGLSNYGDNVKFERNPSTTLTFNTDEYVLAGSTCCFGGREILAMHGVNNAKLRIKFKLNTTSSGAYNQFCIFCTDKTVNDNPPFEYGCRVRNDKLFQYFTIQSESTVYTHSAYYSSAWYYLEAEKDGTSWTIRLYDSSLSLLKEDTRTLSSMTNPNWYIALLADKGTNYSVHIKEIMAEPI